MQKPAARSAWAARSITQRGGFRYRVLRAGRQAERRAEAGSGAQRKRGRQRLGGAQVEPGAAAQHRGDEADRSPQPHRAVAPRPVGERRQRDRLHQRQRGGGERARAGNQPGDRAEAFGVRQQREAGRVGRAAEHDDAALPAGAVGERAPGGRRDYAHEGRQRDHPRDLGGAQAAPRKIGRKVRDVRSRIEKEGEIEAAQVEMTAASLLT